MAESMQNVVIGKRQILRELKNGNIALVVIASDAEEHYISSLTCAANENGVEYSIQGSMDEIAHMYGIKVPTGAIGKLK